MDRDYRHRAKEECPQPDIQPGDAQWVKLCWIATLVIGNPSQRFSALEAFEQGQSPRGMERVINPCKRVGDPNVPTGHVDGGEQTEPAQSPQHPHAQQRNADPCPPYLRTGGKIRDYYPGRW